MSACPFLNSCQWNNPVRDGGKYWFRATIVSRDVSRRGRFFSPPRTRRADVVWSRRASASSRSYAQTNKQIGGLCLLPAVSTLFLPAVLRRHIPPYSQRTEGGEASGLLACNTIPPHQTSYQGRFLTSASHRHSSSLLPRLFHFPRSTSGNSNWGKLQRPGYCSH